MIFIEIPIKKAQWDFNEFASDNIQFVRQKLQNLIGKYSIPQPDQERSLRISIAKINFI